ncbi:Nn.00g019180.m01.CDS01 [Neocucurbitaria sp. VM-36]
MKPASLPMRVRPRPVCQLCDYIRQQPARRRAFVAASTLKATSTRRQPARTHDIAPRIPTRSIATTPRNARELESRDEEGLQTWERVAVLREELAMVEDRIQAIYDSPKVEEEAVVLQALDGLENIAQQAIAIRSRQPPPAKAPIRQSSAGAILSGLGSEENAGTQRRTRSKQLGLEALPSPSYLSKLAEDLIKHEKVFVSPNVLAVYIHLQRLLARPKTIPEALYLYANKPVPVDGSSPPKFSRPSPKSAKQAIPADLADEALTAAIEAKDLSLALDVVDQTYRTPAWRRHRMITKMGLPSILAGITPLALYMIAQELSVYSGYIDPWTFKMYAFAGLSTYVACTGTLGFVALTTYNDTHDRVVWRPGVPLLDRYLREDERAALDRIACAWGFKELWRRGDEEGEEWEGLRQWILLRGMVLDKPDLMPGMNSTSHEQER